MNTETIRGICLSLTATTESIKWENNLCFMVSEKIFCMAEMTGEFGVCLKCDAEEFATLTERDGVTQAPYMAKNQWVKINQPGALTSTEWQTAIHKSYQLVSAKLTKKQRAALGIEG